MAPRPAIFIHSLRFGFATSSSANHSLIFLPDAQEDLSGRRGDSYSNSAPFVLTRPETKLPYLQVQLEEVGDETLQDEFGFGQVPGFINDLAGTNLAGGWDGLPRELLVEIGRWLLLDGVTAISAGENAGEHPLVDHRHAISPSHLTSRKMRRDPLGFWTLLSPSTGTRMRLSFARAAHPQVQPFRSTWPELVDLKITDRCYSDCSFCYQGSTRDGRHASLDAIERVLDELAACQVLEVVLGGGEPTLHPAFTTILHAIQRRGMHAAFTSRDCLARRHLDASGVDARRVHWAYSILAIEDLDRLASPFPTIHVTMGTPASQPEALLEIARRCARSYLNLVLLGFKRTGRGAHFAPVDYRHWMDTIASSGLHGVSIDSALAAEYDVELQRRGVPSWLYEVEDGRYSMYVDAVRGLCGPSSYCPEDQLFALPSGPNGIAEAFEHINQALDAERLHRALQLEQVSAIDRDDRAAQVLLDAALEGRCERCGAEGASLVSQGLARPRRLCLTCAVPRPG
ncbi:MAG: radical SAM protein [Myxococcales bacterium]